MSMYRCDQCNAEMNIVDWSVGTVCKKCCKINHAQVNLNKARR